MQRIEKLIADDWWLRVFKNWKLTTENWKLFYTFAFLKINNDDIENEKETYYLFAGMCEHNTHDVVVCQSSVDDAEKASAPL